MAYLVHFDVNLEPIPDRARQEVRRTMQEIAEAVTTIPAASPFWSSMKLSLLQIDVEGWRIVYAIDDRPREEIHVVELHPVPR